MKKTLRISSIFLLAVAALLLSGCKKEVQSPSVTVTAKTFTVSSWSWSSPYYYINLSVPDLTSENINDAAVMVYFKTTGSTWFALPYTQYNSPYNYYMGFNTSSGNVQVTWVYDTSFSSGDDPNDYYGTTVRCKVVIIPPAERKANPNINLLDYEAVKKAYHLED